MPQIQIYAFDKSGKLIEHYRNVRGELVSCNPLIAEISVCTGVLDVKKAAAMPKGTASKNGYRVGLWESRPLIPKPIFKPEVLARLLKKKIGAEVVLLGPRLGESSNLLLKMQVDALMEAAQYGWPVTPVPPNVRRKARQARKTVDLKVKSRPEPKTMKRKAAIKTV
jgi:hypothetical protein